MNSGPLVVLPGGFGRAAEKLADTIRHIVDVSIPADRLRKTAQAQADVEVILAKGRADATEIEARAAERVSKQELRRQRNLESITKKAFEALPSSDQLSDSPVDQDWIARFFKECEDISDEQMQQIWGRILAGQVARPGSFAPRTLSVTRDLTKDDANLFTQLCQFVWFIPGVGLVPVLFEAPEVEAAGLRFSALTHLVAMGLIEYGGSVKSYGITDALTEITVSYAGRVHQLKSAQPQRFHFGHTVFTGAGAELARIAGAEAKDEYRTLALKTWEGRGWKEAGQTDPAAPVPAAPPTA